MGYYIHFTEESVSCGVQSLSGLLFSTLLSIVLSVVYIELTNLRANARNVRLYISVLAVYTDLSIFRFVSLLYLRSTLDTYTCIHTLLQSPNRAFQIQLQSLKC